MIRRLIAATFGLLIAAPVTAQAPAGWQMRVDRSTNAADPDDVPEVTVRAAEDGFQVSTGPAVVLWNEANVATGQYTLEGRFTLLEPSNHTNYYGLVYGAGGLEGPRQNYLYFLVAQDGSYLVKHRANDEAVHDVQGRTPHSAVVTPDANGESVNHLQVRVGADQTEFLVNGTVVYAAPKSGMAARTDGIWGVRINHVLPGVRVEGLRIVTE